MKEKEDFSFDYFFNQTKNLQDPDDTSSEEDDNDEDYTDLTSDDENNIESSPSKSNKSPLRKTRVSKTST